MTNILPPRFTLADAERAHAEWGCNCGPSAIAAIVRLTLDEVRPHMGDFERKHYTNPTLMLDILGRLHRDGLVVGWRQSRNVDGRHCDLDWPSYGLARIQWEGPWTKPGVPLRARYRHTHWVGSARRGGDIGIFDINCINNGTGWVSLKNWREITVPWILQECVPRADGKWHITHAIEVDLAQAEVAAA